LKFDLIRKLLNKLLDFFFPSRCLNCFKISELSICFECQKKVSFLKDFVELNGENIYCITLYSGVIKKAIWQLKFNERLGVLDFLENILVKYFPENFSDFDFLLPVPLSDKRSRDRGFNQTELLLKSVSKYFDKDIANNIIIRKKETKPFFKLTKKERIQEVKGAFIIKNLSTIRGKKVLLFDDIITTGTTVKEISSLLYKAGANKVYILGFSRAGYNK